MTKTKEFLYKEQGERLRELRKSFDLNVKEISIESGVSRHTIFRYENGTDFPGIKYLRYLHDRRNVNLSYIFGAEKRMFRLGTESSPPDFGNLQEQVDEMLQLMAGSPQLCFKILWYVTKLSEES